MRLTFSRGIILLILFCSFIFAKPLFPGSKFTTQQRDEAVLRALDYLEKASQQGTRLQQTGHEFVVGLYMLSFRFNNPVIHKRVVALANQAVKQWQTAFSAPSRQLPTNPETLLQWSQMLVMQQTFNKNITYSMQLKNALQEKMSKMNMKAFFLSKNVKKELEPDTIWTKYGAYCTDLIFSFFAWKAGLEPTVGINFSTVFLHGFASLREKYDSLSFSDANLGLYMADFKAYQPLHDLVYVVTHYFLTLTGYTGQRLPNAASFAPEKEFLLRNLPYVVEYMQDPDMTGEMVDSLFMLGVGYENPIIRRAVESILKRQAKSGQWESHVHPTLADEAKTEIEWFHDTVASLLALRDVRFEKVYPQLPFPRLLYMIDMIHLTNK
jgi:hypothetical protein